MTRRPGWGRRIWWATWPGALALGVASLLMVAVTALPLVAAALLPARDVAGTDLAATAGPAPGWRVAWALAAVLALAVPVVVVVVARRGWLGWLLVGMVVSVAVLGVGLAGLGII